MEGKLKQLLQLLAGHKAGYLSSREIAAALKVSSRTVFRYIRMLEEAEGCAIETTPAGYRLLVEDKAAFNAYLCQEAASGHEAVAPVAAKLLAAGSVRVDDLAQQLSYSRSSISRLLPQVAAMVAPYGLQLDSKAHTGLRVLGEELPLRGALFHALQQADSLEEAARWVDAEGTKLGRLLERIKEIENEGYTPALNGAQAPPSDEAKTFITLVLVVAARLAAGQHPSFEGRIAPLPLAAMEEPSQRQLEQLIKTAGLPSPLPNEELHYLALAYRHCFIENKGARHPAPLAAGESRLLVEEALGRVRRRYGASLEEDAVLVATLTDHIAASQSQLLLGVDTPNPYRDEVKSRYPLAHYYTLELAEGITRRTGMPVLPGELGYLTMHVASALERGARQGKLHVAILCSTAFGTAALLKSRLTQQYAATLDVVGVYSTAEAADSRLPVDLYLSTVPMEGETLHGRPVLQLSPFLDSDSVRLLDNALLRLERQVPLEDFFGPGQFFYFERPGSKEKLLDALCDELIRQGIITAAEKQAVLAREALVSTEIFPMVAIPHCIIRRQSRLSFAVLRQPVLWGKGRVRLVVLGCFKERDEDVKRLLMQLYRALSNEENVQRLLACKDYVAFLNRLNAFMKGWEQDDS